MKKPINSECYANTLALMRHLRDVEELRTLFHGEIHNCNKHNSCEELEKVRPLFMKAESETITKFNKAFFGCMEDKNIVCGKPWRELVDDEFAERSIQRMIEAGRPPAEAVQIYVNTVEGDKTQLSEGLERFVDNPIKYRGKRL